MTRIRAAAPPLVLLLVHAGCTAPETDTEHIRITATNDEEYTTLVHLSGTTPEPGTVTVEYGPTVAYGRSVRLGGEPSTEHSGTLLGLPADTAVHWRARVELDGAEHVGDDQEIRTLPLPDDVPGVSPVTLREVPESARYTTVAWADLAEERSHALILDASGNVVWYREYPGQVLAARLSRDRTAMLALAEPSASDTGADGSTATPTLYRTALDGQDEFGIELEGAHHAFVETDTGYAYLAHTRRDIDGEMISGDLIEEFLHEGGTRTVWDAFDALPVVENEGWSQSPADWTHANGLDLDPSDQTYLLSLYRQELVIAIDRGSGTHQFSIGPGGTFALDAQGSFGPQHSPRWGEGSVVLFDNGYGTPSRIVSYQLDPASQSAVTQSIVQPIDTDVSVMGAVSPLEDGVNVSSWGEDRYVYLTDASGDVLRGLRFDGNGVVGEVGATGWLGPG